MTGDSEDRPETDSMPLPRAKRQEPISDPRGKRRRPVNISDCSGTMKAQSDGLK